jgi:hypothetical protein
MARCFRLFLPSRLFHTALDILSGRFKSTTSFEAISDFFFAVPNVLADITFNTPHAAGPPTFGAPVGDTSAFEAAFTASCLSGDPPIIIIKAQVERVGRFTQTTF